MISTEDDQQTPLHKASHEQCPKVVEQLLKLEDPMVNEIDQNGYTALHYASRNGDEETVRLLLKKGADCKLKVSETGQSALALSVSTFSRMSDEKGLWPRNGTLKEGGDEYKALRSSEEAVMLIANESAIAEKQLVMRQFNQEEEFDMLAKMMEMADTEKEESKLIWYASKHEHHDKLHKVLSRQGLPSSSHNQEYSVLQVAAYHGKHAVVWWLLKTTPDSQKARNDRRKAIALAWERKRDLPVNQNENGFGSLHTEKEQKHVLISKKIETKGQNPGVKDLPNRSKERENHKLLGVSQGQQKYTDFPLTIAMLKDPPPVEGKEDSYDLRSMPLSNTSGPVIDKFDATIVDFYQRDGRVDFLRRSYSVRDVVYKAASSDKADTNNGGPEQIMEQARKILAEISPDTAKESNYLRDNLQMRWIHLPANNMKWMEDLTQRVYYDKIEKSSSSPQNSNYSSLRRFLKRSWHEVTSSSKPSNFMKPSCSRQKIAGLGSIQRTAEAENPTSEDQKAKNTGQIFRRRGGFEATALYIPYLTFGKCYSLKDEQKRKLSGEELGHQHTYKELIDACKGDVVHGTRSLYQFYYYALEDLSERDQNQVVTRALVGGHKGKEMTNRPWWPIITVGQLWLWVIDEETIITCATHRNDGFDDPVVGPIINQFYGNQAHPPSSVDGLCKFILQFIINFIHTATWRNSSFEETPFGWSGNHTFDSRTAKDIFAETIQMKEVIMLQALVAQQESVWTTLLKNSSFDEENSFAYIMQDLKVLGDRADTVQRFINELLSLEQNEVSIAEANESARQGKESARQGKTIMVFTVVTIVFTPMSFLSSLFALNVSTFQHDSEGNLVYQPGWIYPIIFCVSMAITIPLLMVAVYIEEAKAIVKNPWKYLSGGETSLAGKEKTLELKETDDSSFTARRDRLFSRMSRRSSKGSIV
ncbi:hypothetical protein P170DRAFT_512322 [Aspergillus steynii IBT 23096]|uniref:Uncharacterized protein n=1 Tax=Aspergillus steynii IBT 23096 TaxID=1392250 RepID=A0A2I2FYG4_9EURO|nr:uncharacterized protein P170DRAFT_512322 [Aspergillus steynii IBT 23096]PLB45673.1 hypothetical protein P170DRAFT_512322 [Aspergillus steynii IBT 23096]